MQLSANYDVLAAVKNWRLGTQSQTISTNAAHILSFNGVKFD